MTRDDVLFWLSLAWFVAFCGAVIWVIISTLKSTLQLREQQRPRPWGNRGSSTPMRVRCVRGGRSNTCASLDGESGRRNCTARRRSDPTVRGIDFKSKNFRSEMALAQEATFWLQIARPRDRAWCRAVRPASHSQRSVAAVAGKQSTPCELRRRTRPMFSILATDKNRRPQIELFPPPGSWMGVRWCQFCLCRAAICA
jgi:hypothetical protein